MSFLCGVADVSLRDRVRSSIIQQGLGVEPLLFHMAGWQDDSFTPPWGGVLAMPNWEKALRQTQDTLGRLHLSAGMGTPWRPPRGSRDSWGGGEI